MGIGGLALAFLKAAYTNLSCEVKVGTGRSDPFEVSFGWRQGCILSPLLVSLASGKERLLVQRFW